MGNFCSNCGFKIGQDNKYCSNCGNQIKKENEIVENNYFNYENVQSIKEENKTNTYAIIGFILSVYSLFTCGFTSLLGLIFSIIGIVNSKKYENKGKGFSIAGIIISTIIILIIVFIYIMLFFGENTSSSIDNDSFYGPMY